jgi:glycosyltransferase involved in cell wall biosynthesis
MSMRIGIPYLGNNRWTAGHVYSANLIAALRSLPAEEQPALSVFLGPRRSRKEIGQQPDGCDVLTYGCRDAARWYRALAGGLLSLSKGGSPFGLAKRAIDHQIDVLFPMTASLSAPFAPPWIAWVADYQCMHFPENWSDNVYQRNIETLSRRAPFLVVSSEDAKRDAEQFFERRTNIATLPFALLPTSEWSRHDPMSVARGFGLPERFVLFPSQFWKHKDHETLIRAMLILKRSGRNDMTLVLCGMPKDFRDPAHGDRILRLIRDHGLSEQIRVLDYLPRADVMALMRRAVGIVQPSRFEGWSALVEEARTLGKLLIVSDLRVHREQRPPRARFFPCGDFEALAAALSELWEEGAPGPDPEIEERAGKEAMERGLSFGRRFIEVAREAIRVFKHR